jgi:hypothetical protein
MASELADHWQLIRKRRECWERLGINSAEALRVGALARSVLARTRAAENLALQKDPGTLAAALILENYESNDFRTALGINRFEDVTWFKKESFEETLTWTRLFLLPECDDPDNAALVDAAAEALLKAEEASGYRLDALLGALTGDKEKKVTVKRKKRG